MIRKTYWDGLFAFCLVAILALLAYLLLGKPSKAANLAYPMKSATQSALYAKAQAQDSQAAIDRMKWKEGAQTLASTELDQFTKLVQNLHLQLVSFRSEKEKSAGEVDQLPSTLVVQGSFVNVMGLLDQIEAPSSRYLVQRLEITQTGKGDEVNAAFALGAFVDKEAA